MTIRRSGAFHVVHSGVLPRASDDKDLFGARGLLPDLDLPTLSIPGVGDLTSILNLPSPDTSTTSSSSTSSSSTSSSSTTTSVPAATTSNAISLTTSSGTSSTTSTTSSSSTTTSATTASTSAASSTTPLLPSTSDTATATPPPSATSTPTPSQPPTVTVTSSNTSSSSSPTSTSQTDSAPKSFLQNKALSVGVITAASLVGIVLIIALATWVIRKRRLDRRLDQDIIDFSNAGLVNEHDTEKGGAGGFGASPSNVETGSTGSANGSSLGHGNTIPPPVQPRQMYQDMSYGAAAAYSAPARQASRDQQANPYGGQNAYGGTYAAYPKPSNTYQPPGTTYNTWNWNYGHPGAGAPQYDQAYSGMDDAYSGYADARSNVNMAGYGAGAQQTSAAPLQRRPSAQRKPAPQLDLASESSASQHIVTTSISAPSTNSATPPPPEKDSYSKFPVPGPLPDEFGASMGSPTEFQEPRRLVVRND